MEINILGTDYEVIRQDAKQNPKLENANGICEQYSKKIIVETFEDAKADVMCVENLGELEKKSNAPRNNTRILRGIRIAESE